MTWRKSSYSDAEGACIEVRNDLSALRDSKNAGGPTLHTAGIRHMLRFVKASNHDFVATQGNQ